MNTIAALYQKFLNQQCSREEAEYLLDYFQQHADAAQITALIQGQLDREDEWLSTLSDDEAINRNRELLQEHIGKPDPKKKIIGLQSKTWSFVAAAVVLFLISISFYLFVYQPSLQDADRFGDDVLPGGHRAYMSLSNGHNMILDSTQTGLIAINGKHVYEDGKELVVGPEAQFATIHTPIGGEYHLTLPDGTKAWLNANSALTYPLQFNDSQRVVEITGEVYLEVARNQDKSFIVRSKGQNIQVLGTAFNVRNYDAQTITTLLHGKIALTNEKTDQRQILTPGQQALIQGTAMKIKQVDPNDFISWKDGYITNVDADIHQVCRELERWYDIKFVFADGFKNQEKAVISLDRQAMLSSLLVSLETTYGVQFSIKGKEVLVH